MEETERSRGGYSCSSEVDDRQRVQSARQSKSSTTSPNGLYVLSVFTARVVALRAISSITVAVSDVLMGDRTKAG